MSHFQPWLAGRKDFWPDDCREEKREFSLLTRLNSVLGDSSPHRAPRLRSLLRWDADVYEIMSAEDVFKVVLHLPKPMAEILDDFGVARTYTEIIHNYTYGPAPEFVGPPMPSFEAVLHRVLPTLMNQPSGFKLNPPASPEYWNKTLELLVQPTLVYIQSLPILGVMKHE